MPTYVKVALGMAWFQTVMSIAAGVLIWIAGMSDIDHGRTADGQAQVLLAIGTTLAGIVVGVSAVFAARRRMWAKVVIQVVEGLNMAGVAFILMTTGNFGLLVHVAMPVMIVMGLQRERDWFTA